MQVGRSRKCFCVYHWSLADKDYSSSSPGSYHIISHPHSGYLANCQYYQYSMDFSVMCVDTDTDTDPDPDDNVLYMWWHTHTYYKCCNGKTRNYNRFRGVVQLTRTLNSEKWLNTWQQQVCCCCCEQQPTMTTGCNNNWLYESNKKNEHLIRLLLLLLLIDIPVMNQYGWPL